MPWACFRVILSKLGVDHRCLLTYWDSDNPIKISVLISRGSATQKSVKSGIGFVIFFPSFPLMYVRARSCCYNFYWSWEEINNHIGLLLYAWQKIKILKRDSDDIACWRLGISPFHLNNSWRYLSCVCQSVNSIMSCIECSLKTRKYLVIIMW